MILDQIIYHRQDANNSGISDGSITNVEDENNIDDKEK